MISMRSFRWFSKNHNIYMKHRANIAYQQLQIKSEMKMSMYSIFNFSANLRKHKRKIHTIFIQ